MGLDFRNDIGFAVSTGDQITIAPPRIEPDVGPEGRDDEYQFGVRHSGERYGVSLLVAAGAKPDSADGVVRCRLEDAAAVRQILKIRERSASEESAFEYLCAFSRGLLLAIAGSDDRAEIAGYIVTSQRPTLLAAGIPAKEVPLAGDDPIDLARLHVSNPGGGGLA